MIAVIIIAELVECLNLILLGLHSANMLAFTHILNFLHINSP